MTDISDLQPLIVLHRNPNSPTFDLVLRWVPKLASWLPGPDDTFWLTIEITVSGNAKYLWHDGLLHDEKPAENNRPHVRPNKPFMLDPPRAEELMPFVSEEQTKLQKWLQGKRPTKDVNCTIDTGVPFPFTIEGFGVCHLLKASQPSDAAFRVKVKARTMVKASIDAFLARGGKVDILQTSLQRAATGNPIAIETLADAIAESLAIYLVSRTFQRDRAVPKEIIPAINAGMAELQEVTDELRRSGGLGTESPIEWKNPIFTFVEQDRRTVERTLLSPHASGPRRSQIELRYIYAAIVTHCLSENENWRVLNQEATEAEQARNQIRLRAIHGGTLIDFTADGDAGWKGAMGNSSEIVGLGKTFTGFTEQTISTWEAITLTVAHVPGELKRTDILLPEFQTIAVKGGSITKNPATLKGLLSSKKSTESEPSQILSKLGSASFRLCREQIRLAALTGNTLPPTPPRWYENGAKSVPRINFDLMQSDISQPIPKMDQVVPPLPTTSIGYNTGDGKVEILMGFETDGTRAVRNSGGFNVYVMWETPPLKKYFENWGGGSGLSRAEWLTPPMGVLRPFLVTRRYSYLRDLRGSLKSVAGSLPGIQKLMQDPPKQCIFPRPDKDAVTDILEREKPSGGPDADESGVDQSMTKMPNVVHEEEINGKKILLTAWAGDLRKGMKKLVNPLEVDRPWLKQWDPAGGIDFSWTPELDRDRDISNQLEKPQAYRIWVTTSDFFDQESAAVPVYCHDAAFPEPTVDREYEKWLYRPVRRAPIEAAFSTQPDGLELRKLSIKEVTLELTVEWETPYYNSNSAGHYPGDTPERKRPPKTDVDCYVAIFRKLVNDRGDSPPPQQFAKSRAELPTIPDLPQWETARTELISRKEESGWEGWEQFGNHYVVHGADLPAGDSWSKTITLSHQDRGYDYIALVGAQVKDGSRTAAYFAPNVLDKKRRLQGVEWDSQAKEYKLKVTYVNETPRVSFPERTRADRLANPEEPRGVNGLVADPLQPAKPVLPPPSIQRDLVLTKLLTQPVNADNEWWYYDRAVRTSDAPTDDDWTIAAYLNRAQIAMLESSLGRTIDHTDIDNRRYINTRRLMAEAFKHTTAGSGAEYSQHMTVGFRGLKHLKWNYQPLKNADPATISQDEAEATVVRLWQVRVESDSDAAKAYASVLGRASQVSQSGDEYTFRLTPEVGGELKGITDIICQSQPALVRLESTADRSLAWYGNVTGFVDYLPGNACQVRGPEVPRIPITSATLRFQMGEKPVGFPSSGQLLVRLFVAQPLAVADQKIDFSKAIVEQEIYIPVGGGPSEVYAWWIGTLSAKTREAGLARRVFAMEIMEPTIEPRPPLDVRLAPPTDPMEHGLNPAIDRELKWLPEHIRNHPELARITPRTVLTWRPYTAADKVGIKINRNGRLASKPSTLRKLMGDADPWIVIKRIELLSQSEKIERQWIDQLVGQNGWLLGTAVQHPEVGTALPDFVDEAPYDLSESSYHLSGDKGIKLLDPPATTESLSHASFIDYNRDNTRLLAMTVDYEYQYELVPYLDLGASLPASQRFLFGKPSDVTPWQRPENPQIQVAELSRQMSSPLDWKAGPYVKFVFVTASNRMKMLQQLDEPTSWRYRIVVRRHLPYSLRPTAADNTAIGWEDVGSPISMWPNSVEEVLFDYNVERLGPDEAVLGLEYRIMVEQFAIFESGEERPVRKQESAEGLYLTNVTVDVPPDEQTEVGTIVRVLIS